MNEKYPRTMHLPWSPGFVHASKQNDDKVMDDVSGLVGVPLVITEKMDGGNTRLTSQAINARSLDGAPIHPSYDWIKAKWGGEWRWTIPDHISIFVEYSMAVHSIAYESLPSPAFLIGVRSDLLGFWAAWEHVEYWSGVLGIPTVPMLARGVTVATSRDLQAITDKLGSEPGVYGQREGTVTRREASIELKDWERSVGKWVRRDHVQTDQHWAHGAWTQQEIKR